MAWILFLGVTLHGIAALFDHRMLGDAGLIGDKIYYKGAVTGTFVNRNAYSVFLGFGFLLGLGLLLHSVLRRGGNRPRMIQLLSAHSMRQATLWLCVLIVAMALIGTASRFGIVVVLGGATAIVGLLAAKHGGGSGRFVATIVGVWTFAILVLLMVFGGPVLERAILGQVDSQDRINLYVQVVHLIMQNPLVGVGLDNFEVAFQKIHRTPLAPDLFWDRAHSTYLTLWAEMGLIAGSIPPLICLALAVRILRGFWRTRSDFALSCIAMGAILIAGSHSLIDFSLEIEANVLIFLTIVALGVRPRRASRTEVVR